MVRLVTFAPEVEAAVRFVEETPPAEIVEATLEKLRAGEAPKALLTAGALAVSRSSELPPDHHGGPVHPVAGIHAIAGLAGRLDGDWRHLPVIQSVALANKHVNTPNMGPAAMVALAPADPPEDDAEALLSAFRGALADRQARAAERHLVALTAIAAPGRILDAMLSVALRRNALDDHYFLYPLYAFRALENIGWEWAPVLLRPPVRYLAGHPVLEPMPGFKPDVIAEGVRLYEDFASLDRLIDDHGLTEERVRQVCDGDESRPVGDLAARIGAVDDLGRIAGLLARALAGGLSLQGAGEALSIGGARLFLRSDSGNPFDVHVHTGINARRYLLRLAGVGFRNKLHALLNWCLGTEVRYVSRSLNWSVAAAPQARAELTGLDQARLLDAIADSITRQPAVDLDSITVEVDDLVAPVSVGETLALAEHYARSDFDADALFRRLAELVCRDDVSEMHAYKMQQAAFEEYRTTRQAHRWLHLVAAAKHAAVVVQMQPKPVFDRARALMAL